MATDSASAGAQFARKISAQQRRSAAGARARAEASEIDAAQEGEQEADAAATEEGH
jgi:hypothetical protein